jgi:hypothetical protein
MTSVPLVSARTGRLAGPVLAAVLAAILGAPAFLQPLSTSIFDAGITASSGTFILNGQLPYRDFWLLYGPLAGYISAALTWLGGTDPIVLRVAGYVVVILTALVGQRLVRHRVGPVSSAIIAAVAATIPLIDLGLGLSSWSIAMLFALCAVEVAAERGKGRGTDVLMGVLLALAILARLDLGGYAVIAVTIAFRRIQPSVVAAVIVLPVALAILAIVPWPAVYEQLVWFPIVGQPTFRSTPIPSLWPVGVDSTWRTWLLYWGPVAILLGVIIARIRGRQLTRTEIALLALALLCRLQVSSRPDGPHAAQAAVPALLLLGYLVAGAHRAPTRIVLGLAGALLVGFASVSFLWLVAPADDYDAALREAASIVRTHTQPGERIFVGETSNRYALVNPMLGYSLADRPAGVRDTMYNPGITTTETTQRRMVDDLKANDVRFLLLDERWSSCYETSNQSRVPGSTLLDTAIAQDYWVVADFGALVVMARRDVDVPPIAPGVQLARTPPNDDGILRCRDDQP